MAINGKIMEWEIWRKSNAIYLISIANLILNALSVYFLWTISQALVHHSVAAASATSAAQQIAVVKGG